MYNSHLHVVIPAAGESRRFLDQGYLTPKPFLQVKVGDDSRMMVEHVINSLSDIIHHSFITVAVHDEVYRRITPFVNTCIVSKTIGQADTIYQVVKHFSPEDKVLVLDCDMVLATEDLRYLVDLLGVYDVSIAVTETIDPNSSRVDQVPFPTRFVEKEGISQWGIVGARAFKNAGYLTDALKRVIDRSIGRSVEPYLSTAINHYPGEKYAHVIKNYMDWGTPERLLKSGAHIVDS